MKSIIMSGPMVRAILYGDKSQTRRVIRSYINDDSSKWNGVTKCRKDWYFYCDKDMTCVPVAQPFKRGDVLAVREKWRTEKRYDKVRPSRLPRSAAIDYAAGDNAGKRGKRWGRWRSSIFMPLWAVRLWLEIVSVRAERLQEIHWKEDDLRAEGIDLKGELFPTVNAADKLEQRFIRLWDSLNAKRGFPWAANNWVWRVEFRRAERKA